MRKFIVFLIAILLIPLKTYALLTLEEYPRAKINFTINNEWTKTDFNLPKNYLDKKWESQCGLIMSGANDIYGMMDSSDLNGLKRIDFNYNTLFNDDSFANELINGWKQEYSINNWEYRNYDVKFIYFDGVINESGIDIYYETYVTINNGYMIMFQYTYNPTIHNNVCNTTILDVVKSVNDYTKHEGNESDKMYDFNYGILILDLILTIVFYLGYPFFRVVITKKKYTEKECKKMALWNSIIVGAFFMILTISQNQNATWNAGPAFLYYWINSSLWIDKNSKEKKKTKKDFATKPSKNEKMTETFKCDNCGATVKENDKNCKNCNAVFDETIENNQQENLFKFDNCGTFVKESETKCPGCGEIFEDETSENNKNNTNTNLSQKYEDLTKLKELLDKDIITKEEFDKEKKKILKD